MADPAQIKAALEQMNPEDDTHWLTDGKARMSVVEQLVGKNVDRPAVEAAWPGFNRTALEEHLTAQIADMTGDTAQSGAEPVAPEPAPELTPEAEAAAELAAETPPEDVDSLLIGEDDEVDGVQPTRTEPGITYMPEAYGGEAVNAKAGPLSTKLCEMEDGDNMPFEFLYGVWMEQRVYSVERTTNGYTPVFPKWQEHE